MAGKRIGIVNSFFKEQLSSAFSRGSKSKKPQTGPDDGLRVMHHFDAPGPEVKFPDGTCSKCRRLNFRAFFDFKQLPIYGGIIVADLGSDRDALIHSCCPICLLFASILPDNQVSELGKPFMLTLSRGCTLEIIQDKIAISNLFQMNTQPAGRYVSISEWTTPPLGQPGDIDEAADPDLQKFRSSCPSFLQPSLALPPVRTAKAKSIDYNVSLEWIRHCMTTHTTVCDHPANRIGPKKLIKCHDRRVVENHSNDRYVALSYVWGLSNDKLDADGSIGDGLPIATPQTVNDAILVTLKLGFEYLWVDRYCISQDTGNEDTEKMEELSRMDLIYANAELTLVASAGEDPTSGLPGVSSSPRDEAPQVSVGPYVLSSVPADPTSQITSSKWFSRGWTFQEAVFSRRMLFFTKQELVFMCQRMECRETVRRSKQTGISVFKSPFIVPSIKAELPEDVLSIIQLYTKRQLTRDSDALNAFLGVLRSFGDLDPPVHNYWGVPLYPLLPTRATKGLEGFTKGMCWELEGAGERREGFPSWSWTGWTGVMSTNNCFDDAAWDGESWMGPAIKDDDAKILVELDDRSIRWSEFKHEYFCMRNERERLSRFFRIECWTVDLKLEYGTIPLPKTRNVPSHFVTFKYDGRWIRSAVTLLSKTQSEVLAQDGGRTRAVLGLLMGPLAIGGRYPFVMVAEDRGEYWERIGHSYFGRDQVLPVHSDLSNDEAREKWRHFRASYRIQGLRLQRRKMRLG